MSTSVTTSPQVEALIARVERLTLDEVGALCLASSGRAGR